MRRKFLAKVGALATIGGGLVALHGMSSPRWKRAHAVFTILGLLASVASFAIRVETAVESLTGPVQDHDAVPNG